MPRLPPPGSGILIQSPHKNEYTFSIIETTIIKYLSLFVITLLWYFNI